jgi:uncharacterized protein (DUF1684 family)
MGGARLAAPFVMLLAAACAGSGGNRPDQTARDTQTPAKPDAAPQTAGSVQPDTSDPYVESVRRFQRDREASLKTDTGWLTIAGLFFLSQPKTTFGSDPLSDIVLPPGAPAQAGTFEVNAGKVTVHAAPGVTFKLGDKTITNVELKSDAEGPPDRITLGDLQLWVHMSGGRLSIRLRDRNSRLRQEFAGTSWFPIDKAYRVEATYQPYGKPKIVQVPNVLGDIDDLTVPGIVSFTLNGQPLKMEAVTEGDDKEFWFIFRDMTSGKETYPAARFLYMPAPVNGKMILDFNLSENPPCAYNPYTTCPLPPQQNRLRVRIEAGEKTYAGHS